MRDVQNREPLFACGEFYLKGASFAKTFALNPNLSVVEYRNILRNGKSDPNPHRRRGFLKNPVKYFFMILRFDTHPRIGNLHKDPVPLAETFKRNFSLAGEFNGVPDQVDKETINHIPVAEHL